MLKLLTVMLFVEGDLCNSRFLRHHILRHHFHCLCISMAIQRVVCAQKLKVSLTESDGTLHQREKSLFQCLMFVVFSVNHSAGGGTYCM